MNDGYFLYYTNGREPLRYGLSVVTPPASEPITVAEAKQHCRVDISTDDAYIGSLITVAREYVENVLGRRIVTQTWDLKLDRFPPGFRDFRVPYGPWQSITSIQYIALDGTTQTWASTHYNLDAATFEPRVYLSWMDIYPVPRPIQNAVTIRHVSGYATVPENYKHMVRLLVSHYYDTARNVVDGLKLMKTPRAFDSLLAQERQSWL